MTAFLLAVSMLRPFEPSQENDAGPRRSTPWAEIRVVDRETGRGVPLVELRTVNGLPFVTDNTGRVAFQEPGLLGEKIFFFVKSHGYDVPKDGFGYAGVRVIPRAGQVSVIKIRRQMPAERLCRLTGEGCYRDTLLLGYASPRKASRHPGRVAGQDTVQAAIYQNKVYWFWGDTNRMSYPLGLFRTAGATSPVPGLNTKLEHGIPFEYFTDPKTGFVRAMMPLSERPEGVIWIHGVCIVKDPTDTDRLIGHYSRRKSLDEQLEHGVAVFDPDQAIFTVGKRLPLGESWRFPSGHPITYRDQGTRWLLFGSPHPNVRVPATLEAVLDPTAYEAFTCARADAPAEPHLDNVGRPVWRWQNELPPTDSKIEARWVREGKVSAEATRFYPVSASDPKHHIVLHRGSVRWNAYRNCWLMVGGEVGGESSYLGEVWLAEANLPTGPFRKAVKIITHNRQSFYNICHHAFMDQLGGQVIHLEGTYCNTFSGNPDKTPRYDYNQILYRLDLNRPAVKQLDRKPTRDPS